MEPQNMAPHHHKFHTKQLNHPSYPPPPPESNTVKQVVGNLLHYARTVYSAMILKLNSITSEQANSTQATAKAMIQLINYSAMNYETITRYHGSVMALHIHSDTYFLSDPETNIRAGGYH